MRREERGHEDTKTRRRSFLVPVFIFSSLIVIPALVVRAAADADWPVNGGIGNIRYSPLTQINRTNVARLEVAWTYDSHDAFKGSEMQSNPVVVDGMLYVTTPTLEVIAVNAETGREIWK